MRAWWNRLTTDEAYFRTFSAKVGRFCLSVGAAGIAAWADAPPWVIAASAAVGQLVNAGNFGESR